MSTLGSVIAARLQELGMTQNELASALCISKQYMSDIIRGNRHPHDWYFLQEIGAVLHLSQEYMLFLAGILPPDIRDREAIPEQVMEAFHAMRKVLQASSEKGT